MKGRNKLLIGVAVLILIGLGVVVTGRREPEYQGKKLSDWVLKVAEENMPKNQGWLPFRHNGSPETEAAILAIGTNGIPFYLEWLDDKPRGLRQAQIYIARKSPKWFKHSWRPINDREQFLRAGSMVAFTILGPRAESAVPMLAQYATNHPGSSTPEGQGAVLECLSAVGEPALPVFLDLMTNSSASVRRSAVYYSAKFSTNSVVIERLKERLKDPDDGVRVQAQHHLGRFGGGR